MVMVSIAQGCSEMGCCACLWAECALLVLLHQVRNFTVIGGLHKQEQVSHVQLAV